MKFSFQSGRESLLLIFLVIFSLFSPVAVKTVGAPPDPELPKMYVDPEVVTTNPGATFTVNIEIANVTDLYAWECSLSWKPDLLEAISVTEGPFLKKGGKPTYFPPPDIRNPLGQMTVGCSILGVYPGESGSGTLAYVRFKVETAGNSTLNLYGTLLHDSGLNLIDHTVEDGYVESFGKVDPIAEFKKSPEVPEYGIVNETVTFNASASYDPDNWNETDPVGIVNYTWDFDDGNITSVSGPFITHVYKENKTYLVTLNVTDDEGASATKPWLILIAFVDVAIIDVKPASKVVTAGETVEVTVTLKNLGDREAENVEVTAYYYNATFIDYIDSENTTVGFGLSRNVTLDWTTTGVSLGTYTIKANVTSPYGEKEQDTANNQFINGNVTISKIGVYLFTVKIGGITFEGTIVSNSSVSRLRYQPEVTGPVNFNQTAKELSFKVDGPSGTTGFANVTIPIKLLNGYFNVSINGNPLVFTPTQNATYSSLYFNYSHSSHVVRINGTTVATPPVVDFTVSKTHPWRGEEIKFNASASYDPDGTIVMYTWDFGDHNITTTTDPIIYHTYQEAAWHVVVLNVTDNDGLNATKKFQFIVVREIVDIAVVEVVAFSPEVVAGDPLSINVTVKNEGDKAETFDVNVYYSNVSHSFTMETYRITLSSGALKTTTVEWDTTGVAGGTYTITANVTLPIEADLTDNSKSTIVMVFELPIVDFEYSPSSPLVGDVLTFDASVSEDPDGTIVSYKWDFGDGNVTTVSGAIITHVYSNAGTYLATLNLTDNDGLTDAISMQITIRKLSSEMTLSASHTTITIGDTTVLNGTMYPVREGATVILQYSLAGGTWTNIATVTTNQDGEYSYEWKPPSVGDYEVKALWNGDANTNGSESPTASVTVQEAPLNILIYVALGIAIAAVGLVALYVLKLRRPKSTKTI